MDIPALLAALRAIPYTNPEAAQPQMLGLVRRFREAELEAGRIQFTQDGDALALTHRLCQAMDGIIASLCAVFSPSALGMAVIATGGYGRGELFPYSDIDLLFLYRSAARGPAERLARAMLYVLWDMGLKVGHSLRTEEDALALAQEDLTIRTNLLDARLVSGDREMFSAFMEHYRAQVVEGSAPFFVEAKLAERDGRHKRFGDSRYMLEPNIKEGKGGLRDLQTLYWITKYVYGCDVQGLVTRGFLTQDEYALYAKALEFFGRVRAQLHFLAGKPEERLTFDRQQALAPLLGFQGSGTKPVERMMKRYFLTAAGVGSLTRIVCALLEEQHQRKPKKSLPFRLAVSWRLDGFVLDGDRLNIDPQEDFRAEPLRMLKLFQVAQKNNCDIHPQALQAVARSLSAVTRAFQRDAKANALFLEMLLSPRGPEEALRCMNEVGLLPRFIPAFGRVFGAMQFNMYHTYTVDEHTLVALGILHGLERGNYAEEMPVATRIARHVQWRRVLYVALFCHDIAKGGSRDHSEAGADIVRALAERFAFTRAETEMAVWLVKHHLLFTHTAFRRDPNDAQALADFVHEVQSLARLKLLFLLTVADMRAVGPGVWNAWKANLMRGLYRRAERSMQTGRLQAGEPQADIREELRDRMPNWSQQQVEGYIGLCTPEYLAGMDMDGHARVAMLITALQAAGEPLSLDASHDMLRGVTTLTIVAPDAPGLFSRLAGAISLSGANIVGATIFTLKNGLAVDMFQVHDAEGKLFDKPDRISRMAVRMRQAVSGELDLSAALSRQKPSYAQRRDAVPVEPHVFIENDASATHTVVEVVGRDRVGFLYAVTHALSQQGLAISSAHISTYGVQAVDVFYVKDAFGLKITHEAKLMELRNALMEVMAEKSAEEEAAQRKI